MIAHAGVNAKAAGENRAADAHATGRQCDQIVAGDVNTNILVAGRILLHQIEMTPSPNRPYR